jgi:hypothetical protein
MCIRGSILSASTAISKLVQIITQVQRHRRPVDAEAGALATEVHVVVASYKLFDGQERVHRRA